MRAITVASLVGFHLLSSSAIAQDTYEFHHDGWTGHSRRDDPDKGCIMGKHVTNDVYFLIYTNTKEAFSIGVTSETWDDRIGEEIAGYIAFDNAEPTLITGTVVEPKITLFSGGTEEDGFETLIRTNRNLRLAYGHSKFGLSLKGSSKAIDLLYSCADGRESAQPSEPSQLETTVPDMSSLYNLPLKTGYYALTGGTCSEGFGPNTIYTDGKTLSWPSSGCRFEHIKQTGNSTFQVKQSCGRNADDMGTETARYTVTGSTEFSLKSDNWETKGKYCEPSTLPQADRERAEAPIYARSSLGETAAEIADNETTQAAETARVLQMLDDLGKSPHIENHDMQEPTAQQSIPLQSNPSTQVFQADAASPSSNSHMPLRGKSIALSSTDEAIIRDSVSLNLADETSARFRNIAAADMEDGTYIVCGFVNGKNQFGAYTGYHIFYGVYRPVDPIFVTKYIIKPSFGLNLCVASGVEFK